VGAAYLTTQHPAPVEAVTVAGSGGEPIQPGQPVKVLSWNVQYMAGKDYVFFYDLPGDAGPDARPSPEAIAHTLDEVARVITDESPDIVLLQEVDIDASSAYHQDQLALLLERLPADYRYSAHTYYHRALFVPHPKIMGSVGMSLAVISKHPIASATRLQLPLMDNDPFTRMFYFHRCLLQCRLPIAGGGELVVMDTHLDAFAQGTDTMQRQTAMIRETLVDLDADGTPWIIGGDFNLLPPGQRPLITESRRSSYNEQSELAELTSRWASVPTVDDALGADRAQWFTHFPNDPTIKGPDRTIDYIFHSANVQVDDGRVRHGDTLSISDHLPVIITLRAPAKQ
jgi:endonuclease/exonuclease/phosphatase family metal-dependent hydrolase